MPKHSKKPLNTVRLHIRGGAVFEFDSLDDLVAHLPGNWHTFGMRRAFGVSFKTPKCPGPVWEVYPTYVVTDLWSEPIDPEVVCQAWRERYRKARPRRLNALTAEAGRDYRHRQDPVPGTRALRGGGSIFRRVGTTSEMRAWGAATDDDGNPVRKRRRSPAQLPSAWDDILRGDVGDRCWKRHRRTQHKRK